jgi:hypothetical protein
MIFVRSQCLPATFILIPVTPDPVTTAKLRGYQPGRLVERDDRGSLGRWITNGVPDRLRCFAVVGRVGIAGAEIKDGLAASHLHPAIGIRRRRCLPGPGELKDAESWPLAEPDHRPLHAQSRFFPEDSRQAAGCAAQARGLSRHNLGISV